MGRGVEWQRRSYCRKSIEQDWQAHSRRKAGVGGEEQWLCTLEGAAKSNWQNHKHCYKIVNLEIVFKKVGVLGLRCPAWSDIGLFVLETPVFLPIHLLPCKSFIASVGDLFEQAIKLAEYLPLFFPSAVRKLLGDLRLKLFQSLTFPDTVSQSNQ